MEEFTKLLEDILVASTYGIEIGMVCRVESHKESPGYMDVKPLLKTKDGYGDNENFPVLSNLPIAGFFSDEFMIKIPFKRGDLVWVTFSANSIRDALKNSDSIKNKARFNMQDACVIGGVNRERLIPPINQLGSLEGLVLGTKNKNAFIQILDDEIRIECAKITISNGTTSYELNDHTHPTTSPGAPTEAPVPTGV